MTRFLIVTTQERIDAAMSAFGMAQSRAVYNESMVRTAPEGSVLVAFQSMPPGGIECVEAARARGFEVLWVYQDAPGK